MLGSEFEGERAAAALKVTGLLRQVGLSWDEILNLPTCSQDPSADSPPSAPKSAAFRGGFVDWRADLACCERHRSWLTRPEADFVSELHRVLRSGRTGIRSADIVSLGKIAKRMRARAAAIARRERSADGATGSRAAAE
ncbi:MAG TPA: hypothetical protein VE650_07165 [Acetobacteraceae bacterium]|nr:hypothetical protein [Acetobacteraceae bacterium]